jgi:rRNA pseudouridine-1189 N-methylase Emg1 (Nep1/Mra1 family)
LKGIEMENYKEFIDILKKIFELQKIRSNDEIINAIHTFSLATSASKISISELISLMFDCESYEE